MRAIIASFILLSLVLPHVADAAAKKNVKEEKRKPARTEGRGETERPFEYGKASFKEIIDRYLFVADFNQKSPERPVTKEFVWKYPFKLAPVKFDLDLDSVDLKSLVFPIMGSGRKTEAINIGRVAFQNGDYDDAHQVWLAARQEFKDDATTNKILEYFMAINAMASYKQKLVEAKGDVENISLKGYMQRAAYFFASAFILRRDVPEEKIDANAPWALYNLAVVYHSFGRMPSVYGAAEAGLSALIKQGKTLHRSEFRQLLAEAYIKNQDLISAIQELDTAIRQDPDPIQAARMFNRAGDIYFDLNNYELAEDLYAMASAIDRERQVYSPAQALLRAESIFWLGRFEEAERIFANAVDYAMTASGNDWLQETHTLPWALLRVSDTWLAKAATSKDPRRKEYLEKARLAYFKVQSEFPRSEAARIADVRGACLDMPFYEGNNVKHARALLADVKEKKDLPENLTELIWACDAGSYSDRERSDVMVSKIQEFSDKYPNSRFLDAMLPPVREVQGSKIDEYFVKGQWESATDFFEQKRKILFPKVSSDLSANLWRAYVSTSRSKEAMEFWGKARVKPKTDTDALRQAVFLYEVTPIKGGAGLVKDRDGLQADLLKRAWGNKPGKEDFGYLGRVLATNDVAKAYPWILKVQDAWTAGDDTSACSVLFPFLSRIQSDKKATVAARQDVYRRVKEFESAKIAALKDKDKTCFQSWIDFESKVLSREDLRKKYSQREDWALEGPWLERMWSWSEDLSSRGLRDEATRLWKTISEKGTKDSFEARMAKTRLDPRRTEYESLWK
jgi:tetratricopeptide (TPR) repeat protein